MATPQQQRINLANLTPQELYQLKQGFQSELGTLNQHMSQFKYAMDRYDEGKRVIKAVEEMSGKREEIMMPLSNALYIEGYMGGEDKAYTVEYGAGFFVELGAKQASDFYSRKISLIREKMGKLNEVMNEKREGLKQVQMRMMMIMQQQQDQTQKAAK